MSQKKFSAKRILAMLFLVLIVVTFACACSDGGSSHHSTNTCKSCGRSYEAGDSGGNFMNIARTGMCKNCYDNFKWGQSVLGN